YHHASCGPPSTSILRFSRSCVVAAKARAKPWANSLRNCWPAHFVRSRLSTRRHRALHGFQEIWAGRRATWRTRRLSEHSCRLQDERDSRSQRSRVLEQRGGARSQGCAGSDQLTRPGPRARLFILAGAACLLANRHPPGHIAEASETARGDRQRGIAARPTARPHSWGRGGFLEALSCNRSGSSSG